MTGLKVTSNRQVETLNQAVAVQASPLTEAAHSALTGTQVVALGSMMALTIASVATRSPLFLLAAAGNLPVAGMAAHVKERIGSRLKRDYDSFIEVHIESEDYIITRQADHNGAIKINGQLYMIWPTVAGREVKAMVVPEEGRVEILGIVAEEGVVRDGEMIREEKLVKVCDIHGNRLDRDLRIDKLPGKNDLPDNEDLPAFV